MEEKTVTWRIFAMYMLLIILMLLGSNISAQVTVTHYNAEWNKKHDVEWIKDLKDCDITKVDIAKYPKLQKKHKIVVVPTIIIFKDGEEVERFQADISFSVKATIKELQEVINEQLMSDF